ncbi:hypothetical protein DOY81_015699 [Sarcophaga bullata]|nr:hypothetical protein DOY81_015699 [Sarcophaga bullata]
MATEHNNKMLIQHNIRHCLADLISQLVALPFENITIKGKLQKKSSNVYMQKVIMSAKEEKED